MKHSLYHSTFLSLAFGFTAAFAQTDGPRQPGAPGGGFGGMGGAERKLVAQFDKDGDKRLNAEERKEAREFLKKNPGGGRGPGGGGRGGPGGGRLAPSLAAPLLAALDGDKDGGMSEAEWKAGLKQFFTAADGDKKESIDATQLGEALNAIIPPPPGAPQGGLGDRGRAGQVLGDSGWARCWRR